MTLSTSGTCGRSHQRWDRSELTLTYGASKVGPQEAAAWLRAGRSQQWVGPAGSAALPDTCMVRMNGVR
jgi:hypothetical protein